MLNSIGIIIKGGSEMDFNEYLQKALEENYELKKAKKNVCI